MSELGFVDVVIFEIPLKPGKPGEARKIDKMLRAREAFFILQLSCWLGTSLAGGPLPLLPTPPPPAGCLAALLVIRNAALQLYCFPIVLGYQNIDILGGFGTMQT